MDRKKDFFVEAANEFFPDDAPYPKSRAHTTRNLSNPKKNFSKILKDEENRQTDENGEDIKS